MSTKTSIKGIALVAVSALSLVTLSSLEVQIATLEETVTCSVTSISWPLEQARLH